MAEDLTLTKGLSREEIYIEIIPQIEALVYDEKDEVANLANIAAVLKEAFDFFWVGFYMVKEDQLVLGPFQGPVACTRIHKSKGVCGASWSGNISILVPDVAQYPGHIACNSKSKSEIVLPASKHNEVYLILDVDSDQLNDFSKIDEQYLKKIIHIIEKVIA